MTDEQHNFDRQTGFPHIYKSWLNRQMDKILSVHREHVTGLSDLAAEKKPSIFFYLFGRTYGRAMCSEPDLDELRKAMRWRRRINPFLKKLVPASMKAKQIFENRNKLMGLLGEDKGINLPDEPVIWTSNHYFKDDAAATMTAAKRYSWLIMGSLPHVYNTADGIFSWINGELLLNRKAKASRSSIINRAVAIMKAGPDLVIFPEGVWNKTPERLLIDLWPGIYRVAKEVGAKIVPVVHYIDDMTYIKKDNVIHTVVDDPVDIADMSEEEALEILRDIMATWHYLMMERYGRTTRSELLAGFESSADAWRDVLTRLVKTAGRYDIEIELCADYRPNENDSPCQVWSAVADIKTITPANAASVAYAYNLVEDLKKHDYQHSY